MTRKRLTYRDRVTSAIRSGILAARKDATQYGIEHPAGSETPHLFTDQAYGPMNMHYFDAYRHEQLPALDRFQKTLTPAELFERDRIHNLNIRVRNAKDPALAWKVIQLEDRVEALENA